MYSVRIYNLIKTIKYDVIIAIHSSLPVISVNSATWL